jgi:competence protein ComEC
MDAPVVAPLSVRAPLLAPAIAVVGGSWLAAEALPLSVPLLLALGCAGAAWGERGWWLAFLAGGLLWSSLAWVEPHRRLVRLDADRPVALRGEVSGCWSRDLEGDAVWLLARWARQGTEVQRVAARLRVHLPVTGTSRGCGGSLEVRGYLRPPRRYRNAVVIEVGSWSMWVKSVALTREIAAPGIFARASHALRARIFAPTPGAELDESVEDPELADRDRRDASVPTRVDRGAGAASEASAQSPADRAERSGLALARALLLGDARALPVEQREAMRRVGLAHLVAVSGLNVGMVAALLLALLLRAPRPVRLLGALAGVCLYALLVGPLPSLLRAVLMAAAVAGALLLRRLPQACNGLAAACLLMVLLDPSWVRDLGFQLSVAATAGLLAFVRPLARQLAGARWLATPLAVTLAAQLATLPWAIAAFGRVSAVAPLANLLAVPWAAVALAVALAWAAARLAIGEAADVLLVALDILARPLDWLEVVPASPWVSLPLLGSWWVGWGTCALLGWWLLRPGGVLSAAARVGGAAALLLLGTLRPPSPDGVQVVLLDVGQGDAVLLRDGRRAVLVDGGGWRRPGFGGRVLVPALGALGIRRLDALAVTHADLDHCAGAADLLAELPVGEVWMPPGLRATECGERLAAGGRAPWRELAAGDAARVGRWRVRALAPERAAVPASDNAASLVLMAEAAARRVLLTGDLETRGESALLERWSPGGVVCDLLKVAHHGSRSSSGPRFLAAAHPRLALVSAGLGNPYGHPSPVVLDRLARGGIPVLRTDRDGMVTASWNGPRGWRLATAPH